jgi:hypothetical protein
VSLHAVLFASHGASLSLRTLVRMSKGENERNGDEEDGDDVASRHSPARVSCIRRIQAASTGPGSEDRTIAKNRRATGIAAVMNGLIA